MTSVYLDVSVIVSIFVQDRHTDKARAVLQRNAGNLVISDFGAAEFASALNRRVRMRELTFEKRRLR